MNSITRSYYKTEDGVPYISSKKSDHYKTPDKVFDIIEKGFHIKRELLFDPCPYHSTFNGLMIEWKSYNFVNPPYELLNEFVQYAIMQSKIDVIPKRKTILLLPSKTEQQWFHDLLVVQHEIYWIRRRLTFVGEKHNSPQPHFLIKI